MSVVSGASKCLAIRRPVAGHAKPHVPRTPRAPGRRKAAVQFLEGVISAKAKAEKEGRKEGGREGGREDAYWSPLAPITVKKTLARREGRST